VDCHISATCPKLHMQQLPHGKKHAQSDRKWGQGPFQNKKYFIGMFFIFFLQGRKSKLTQITGTKNIFKFCLNNKFRGLFTMNIFCEIFCQTKFKEFQMISKNFKFIHYCVKCQSQIGSYNSFKLCKLIPIGFKHLCISP